MDRVLHIHVTALGLATEETQVSTQVDVRIGIDGEESISFNLTPEITLKTLGVYKTAIQMNVAIADAVKSYAYDTYSIPTNGYVATYVSGAYGLLNVL